MADNKKGEMIKGQIDTVILLALVDGDKDSNDICVFIEEKSNNQYSVKQGTFYSAMQRLVKKNLIKEYRSSAVDGIRRKYYKLTPSGSKYLEKTREQWIESKALVDNLIDAEPTPAPIHAIEEPKPQPEQVDEFESFKAFAQNSVDDFAVETHDTEDDLDYFNKIGESVLNEVNEELNKLNLNETDNQTTQTISEIPVEPIVEKVEEIPEKIEDSLDNYENLSSMTKDELFDFEMIEEISEVKEEEPILVESTPAPTQETTPPQPKPAQEIKPQPIKSQEPVVDEEEIDDQLLLEENVQSHKYDYKRLLNRFMPTEKHVETPVQKPIQPIEDTKEQPTIEPILVQVKEPVQQKNQAEPKQPTIPTVDGTDFSDLYEMAQREGFKIKTSYNTNKYLGNQILLNKLNFHGSLLFFILLTLQALILNFALENIVGWDVSVKLIILGCLAVFPLICLLLFILSPKRAVPEVSSFKDAMGLALLITIQSLVLIVCVAIFIGVDFNNFKELATYIILPLVLVLNIPLYFILKYSLLSTGKYFTE